MPITCLAAPCGSFTIPGEITMTYTITYTNEHWQPLGMSFYQTVHHDLDSQTALVVLLECTLLCASPQVHEAAIYHRDGYAWTLKENVDPATVLVCEDAPEGLRERAYGE